MAVSFPRPFRDAQMQVMSSDLADETINIPAEDATVRAK